MKKIFTGLMAFLCIAFCSVQAQEGEKRNSSTFEFQIKGNAADTWLVVDNLSADLIIEGTSSSGLKINAKNYRGLPDKAKGLKPLSATGPENTGVGLYLKQDGNTITLAGAHNAANSADYSISVPKNLKLKISYTSYQGGDILVKGMAGEVEVKSQVGDLELIDVTGPLVANTLSADVNVVFTTVSSTSPTSLSSTSGDIDVTIPGNTQGTFKMSTISGGVYTAYDFDFGDQKLNQIGGQSATGKLNGGGVDILLKSISGDVYIRKPEGR